MNGWQKKRRLREGGVGPEMRSPAGFMRAILASAAPVVKAYLGRKRGRT